jgi:glyoxylase-like metal-dependent hydrolase (beta-lactamase superfamily II)
VNSTEDLRYDVFVNDPPPQDNGLLPNGEPKLFSPQASTLIYGSEDAVLTDPGFTTDQAQALGDWVAGKGRNVTDIFITHGHGDHWFAARLLAERFGARVVATAGTITQMHASIAARPFLWDKLYPGIPPTTVTAVTVPDNRFDARRTRPGDDRGRPHRRRRQQRLAHSRSQAGCGRRCDL